MFRVHWRQDADFHEGAAGLATVCTGGAHWNPEAAREGEDERERADAVAD